MQRVGCWFLAAGMFVAAGQVWAQDPKLDTTAELVEYCDNVGPVGEVRDGQNFCDGFIAGTGLLYLELVSAKKIRQMACADPIPTLAEARQAFVGWAAENAEHMASKPIDGFWRAMAATYPCPK